MWKYAITVAIAIAVAISLFVSFWWVPKNRFEVINESGQTIHDLTITGSGRTYNFGDVGPGELRSAFFYTPQDGESYFEVRGNLNDGVKINDDVEYVVWEEFFLHVTFVIRPDGQVNSVRR